MWCSISFDCRTQSNSIHGLSSIEFDFRTFDLVWNLEWRNVEFLLKNQRNTTWDIPKFHTVLLHSNRSSLRRKFLSKISTDKRIVLWTKNIKNLGNFRRNFPRTTSRRKNPRRMYARGPRAMAKFVLVVPYHKDSPATTNGARLRSPSLIMAPVIIVCLT